MKLAEQEVLEMLRPEPKKPLRSVLDKLRGIEEPAANQVREMYRELKSTPASLPSVEEN